MSEAVCAPWQDRGAAKRVLAKRVRDLRRVRGWTQSELARRAGLSRNVVHTTENAHSYPTGDNLARLAQALGVAVEALSGMPPSAAPILEAGSSYVLRATESAGLAWIQVDRLVRTTTAVAILRLIVEDEPSAV